MIYEYYEYVNMNVNIINKNQKGNVKSVFV